MFRESALSDPHTFVKTNIHPMIIGEVQRAPNLLPAIKLAVDENTAPGQYLLTGPAQVQSLPTIQESLAGRVCNLQLMTLAVGEVKSTKPDFIDWLFRESFKPNRLPTSKEDIVDLALQGGFPEVIGHSSHERQNWHKDYINALLRRDLRDITRISRLDAMVQLVNILATWSGKLIDVSNISSHLSIQRQTVNSYIEALELMYLVERVSPWIKTDYDRVGKSSKIFMSDSGLMASLLNWGNLDLRKDDDRIGKFIETFVFQQLIAQIRGSGQLYHLYHYRDRQKREIDFIIEDKEMNVLGIEVKSSTSVGAQDFKHLNWFKENLMKDKNFISIVLYCGKDIMPFGPKKWAIPISALWHELS